MSYSGYIQVDHIVPIKSDESPVSRVGSVISVAQTFDKACKSGVIRNAISSNLQDGDYIYLLSSDTDWDSGAPTISFSDTGAIDWIPLLNATWTN